MVEKYASESEYLTTDPYKKIDRSFPEISIDELKKTLKNSKIIQRLDQITFVTEL